MPTPTSIALPPVSGFSSGVQPKIYNATPPGTFTSPPQVLPIFSIANRYISVLHLLDQNTRINDTVIYHLYPVPSAGLPTITPVQSLLTLQTLQGFLNYRAEHFVSEIAYKFAKAGTYDLYYEQTNASNTYTVISQNLRFIVQ
ncbi:hypothetical protein HCU66_08300 [Pseudomonas frederiksbergensis]|uniref:hypothetical protein n=1 Tax=Pseudomonas frederiksbergensis TaxID=104087 RepID=UPI0019815AAA|nr:hypothetical protein [Pseudomonas frederiksbergensis]MBN3862227.1 hypothetical protein [Pseudomonas frederiksbergensis]